MGLDIRLSRKYAKVLKPEQQKTKLDFANSSLLPHRTGFIKKSELTSGDVEKILDQILVRKATYQEVSIKLKGKRSLIGRVVKAHRNEPNFL